MVPNWLNQKSRTQLCLFPLLLTQISRLWRHFKKSVLFPLSPLLSFRSTTHLLVELLLKLSKLFQDLPPTLSHCIAQSLDNSPYSFQSIFLKCRFDYVLYSIEDINGSLLDSYSSVWNQAPATWPLTTFLGLSFYSYIHGLYLALSHLHFLRVSWVALVPYYFIFINCCLLCQHFYTNPSSSPSCLA